MERRRPLLASLKAILLVWLACLHLPKPLITSSSEDACRSCASLFADNLELVARSSQELVRVLPVVERFLDLCQLLVAPSKCWFWAICPAARRRLQHTQLLGQKVPLKLQARELGADISYCKRKAAKERNTRATSGFRRMTKLHGLPGSIGRKTRLLLSGIFPHALHAAETSAAPKSVLQRLWSGAALAIDCRPKGASPWLACLLSTYRLIDALTLSLFSP